MKEGWETKTLGEVCDLYQPKTISTKEMIVGGEYTVFGANGPIGKYNKFNHEKPQLLITCRGATCGFVNISEPKSWINGNAMVVKPIDGSVLDLKFLEYLFRGGIDLSKTITGAAQPQITRQSLAPVLFSYPKSFQEQQRIVAILDDAFAKIEKAKANAEQNLKNAKELFESYLQGVFENKGDDWEEKTLKELTSHLGDGLHGTPKYTLEGDYYFINGNNLCDGVIEFKSSTKRVSYEEYNKHKKNLTERTILVSINGTLGNVAFYNNEKIILGKSACYFNMKEGTDKNYIKYVLSSPYFLKYAHKEATGATIKNVSLKTMREFIVPLPSLTQQQVIVQKLDALSDETKKLKAIYEQKIKDLDELKKSVLHKAFSGKL